MSETDVESAVKISLLPKRIGVDAIIVYKDILTPLAPMGTHFRFDPGRSYFEATNSDTRTSRRTPTGR